MNRLLTLCQLVALALFWGTAQAASHSGLTVDSIWTVGRLIAQYDFEVHLMVTNHSDEDIVEWDGFFQLVTPVDGAEAEKFKPVECTWAEVAAGETRELVMVTNIYSPGTYQLFVTQEGEDDFTTLTREMMFPASVTIDIEPYRKPLLRVEYEVNMSTTADSTNVVYGDRVSGRLLLINDDEQPFTSFPNFLQGLGGFDLILVTGLDSTYITRVAQRKIVETIAANDTIAFDFCFDTDMKYGKRYNLGVLWSNSKFGISQVGIYDFESRSGLATYWTADREVKPLPRSADGMGLVLPDDAVAVDLRGTYKVNTVFPSIDTSNANPNCLYYLDFMDNLPVGVPAVANVVRDYEAKSLSVSADRAYYCPMPFEASLAEFSCQPTAERQMIILGGEVTEVIVRPVVFPFEVKRAWYPDINHAADAVFDSRDMGFYRFAGDDRDELSFQPVTGHSLNAYEPYMMWMRPYPAVFSADKTTVPATRRAVTHGTHFDFVGTTTGQVLSSKSYCWNYRGNTFVQVIADGQEEPFMALMENVDSEKVWDGDALMPLTVVGISGVESSGMGEAATSVNLPVGTASPSGGAAPVYTLSGQKVKVDSRHGLKPGLYIIGGRKAIVK